MILMPLIAATTEPSSPQIPKAALSASSDIKAWLTSFRGKTEAEVATVIGSKVEKETWEISGVSELKIRCEIDDDTTLLLLFRGKKVLRAEIFLRSADE
jgi:hypothetical protein